MVTDRGSEHSQRCAYLFGDLLERFPARGGKEGQTLPALVECRVDVSIADESDRPGGDQPHVFRGA